MKYMWKEKRTQSVCNYLLLEMLRKLFWFSFPCARDAVVMMI